MINFFEPTPYQKIWEDYWQTQKHKFDSTPWIIYDIIRYACENAFYAGYEIGRKS